MRSTQQQKNSQEHQMVLLKELKSSFFMIY